MVSSSVEFTTVEFLVFLLLFAGSILIILPRDSMEVDTLPFYKYGIDILHNIDERKAIQTMKSAVEPIAKRTVYQVSEEDDNIASD